MRIASNLFALIFLLTLFSSCSVDELDDDSNQNNIDKIVATGDDHTPPDEGDPPPGNN